MNNVWSGTCFRVNRSESTLSYKMDVESKPPASFCGYCRFLSYRVYSDQQLHQQSQSAKQKTCDVSVQNKHALQYIIFTERDPHFKTTAKCDMFGKIHIFYTGSGGIAL